MLAGSNRAWEKVENVASACLNGISGTRLTLNRYRGMESFLDIAMFDAGVKEATIETMWHVVERNREIPRRYLRSKARIIGKPQLGFQDLACPLPIQDPGRFSWQEATGMVLDAFQSFYPGLAEFARSMLALRRVESEKRQGKRPGAFCTKSLKTRESRVFMTFGGPWVMCGSQKIRYGASSTTEQPCSMLDVNLRLGTEKIFQPDTPYPPNSFPNEIVRLKNSDAVLFRLRKTKNCFYICLGRIVNLKLVFEGGVQEGYSLRHIFFTRLCQEALRGRGRGFTLVLLHHLLPRRNGL